MGVYRTGRLMISESELEHEGEELMCREHEFQERYS